jgi:hypothetical protein
LRRLKSAEKVLEQLGNGATSIENHSSKQPRKYILLHLGAGGALRNLEAAKKVLQQLRANKD